MIIDLLKTLPLATMTTVTTALIAHFSSIWTTFISMFSAAAGPISLIIATIGSFGPGVDVKGIRYVISLDQFDYITDNQLSGRARPDHGKPAFYIMLNDSGFDYCNGKIRRRLGYLSKNKLSKISQVNIKTE